MIEYRLHGTPEEVEAHSNFLRQHCNVLHESKDYRDRSPSTWIRRHLKIELKPASTPTQSTEEPGQKPKPYDVVLGGEL